MVEPTQLREREASWRWRFSLRTLLVLVTLTCILLGTFLVPAYKQSRAVKALRHRGADVAFAVPAGWRRLAAGVLGSDGVCEVARVSFGSQFDLDPVLSRKRMVAPLGDPDLELLTNPRWPRILVLENTQVTKDGLKKLEQLSGLQVLDLDHTSISDDAIDQLVRLRQIKLLSVISTKLTDAGIEMLRAKMPWCKIQIADVEIVEPYISFPAAGYDQTLLADPQPSNQ